MKKKAYLELKKRAAVVSLQHPEFAEISKDFCKCLDMAYGKIPMDERLSKSMAVIGALNNGDIQTDGKNNNKTDRV